MREAAERIFRETGALHFFLSAVPIKSRVISNPPALPWERWERRLFASTLSELWWKVSYLLYVFYYERNAFYLRSIYRVVLQTVGSKEELFF